MTGTKQLVVMVAGNAVGRHLDSASATWRMHLAERRPVLWVDPPISCLTPLRDARRAAALREDRAAPGRARTSCA